MPADSFPWRQIWPNQMATDSSGDTLKRRREEKGDKQNKTKIKKTNVNISRENRLNVFPVAILVDGNA